METRLLLLLLSLLGRDSNGLHQQMQHQLHQEQQKQKRSLFIVSLLPRGPGGRDVPQQEHQQQHQHQPHQCYDGGVSASAALRETSQQQQTILIRHQLQEVLLRAGRRGLQAQEQALVDLVLLPLRRDTAAAAKPQLDELAPLRRGQQLLQQRQRQQRRLWGRPLRVLVVVVRAIAAAAAAEATAAAP